MRKAGQFEHVTQEVVTILSSLVMLCSVHLRRGSGWAKLKSLSAVPVKA